MSSQAGSLSSQAGSLSSWSSLPSAPPSYSNIHRDLRVDGPRTPLLQDYDGVEDDEDEGGLFMRAPEVYYPPPPAYSEVSPAAIDGLVRLLFRSLHVLFYPAAIIDSSCRCVQVDQGAVNPPQVVQVF